MWAPADPERFCMYIRNWQVENPKRAVYRKVISLAVASRAHARPDRAGNGGYFSSRHWRHTPYVQPDNRHPTRCGRTKRTICRHGTGCVAW